MARRRADIGRRPAPPSATPLTVTVSGLGADGGGRADVEIDGAMQHLAVPYVLPGETVEVTPLRARSGRIDAELVRVLSPAADRQAAPCRHFGVCGGCALQHWSTAGYATWKVAAITRALRAQGIEPPVFEPMVRAAAGDRRRADVMLRRVGDGAVVGFARRASHEIVDLAECPVLMPAIVALLATVRHWAPRFLPPGADAEAVVNWIDDGADILLVPGRRLPLDLDRRTALAGFAAAADIARLSWGGRGSAEAVVTRRLPRIRLGRIDVTPPPGAFLQASRAGEAALRACVRDWLGPAKRVVDLYGGIGTLSLGLAPERRVTVVEGDRAAVAAVEAGVRQAALGGAVGAMRRDLARDPLPAEELGAFDAAIFDPPRAGAAAQAGELARSPVPLIIAVSCFPQTFARDVRRLIDGGYRLERLLPVDQFLWSPHVELAALLRR
jgi:23S rRNA (uracil1939-C5)-methyltransferase